MRLGRVRSATQIALPCSPLSTSDRGTKTRIFSRRLGRIVALRRKKRDLHEHIGLHAVGRVVDRHFHLQRVLFNVVSDVIASTSPVSGLPADGVSICTRCPSWTLGTSSNRTSARTCRRSGSYKRHHGAGLGFADGDCPITRLPGWRPAPARCRRTARGRSCGRSATAWSRRSRRDARARSAMATAALASAAPRVSSVFNSRW